MEIYTIAAVKDELTETFLQPTFGESIEAIQRMFEYQINTISLWKENASDFSLYTLGTYNQNTGEIRSEIKKIISGHSVLRKEKKDDIQSVE